MNELPRLLRDGDPLGEDAALSAPDVARMRAAMLAVVPARRFPAAARFALAGVTATSLGLSIWCYRFADREADLSPGATSAAADHSSSERRQLQFVTPGGTRIIWTFNSTFEAR